MRRFLIQISLLSLVIPFAPIAVAAPDSIEVESGDDAVIVRSPMSEGNFLLRLPAGFAATETEAPWGQQLKNGDVTVRLRVSNVPSDKTSSPVADLAAPRAKALGDLVLEGSGGARRIGRNAGKQRTKLALFVRDGTRYYEVLVEFASNDETEKQWREVLEGFTLFDPKGAPEAATADPEALKAKKLTHDYYKLTILKPAGFVERPPDVDGDKGIWKHLRRVEPNGDGCEIRVRIHLASATKLKTDGLVQGAMKRFGNGYNNARIPKRPKIYRKRGSKEGFQVQMAGKVKKSGIVAWADYRVLLHENGRLYEFDMIMYANAKRAFAKELKAFWKSIKIKAKS